jgi:hypothetical protein
MDTRNNLPSSEAKESVRSDQHICRLPCLGSDLWSDENPGTLLQVTESLLHEAQGLR